MDCSTPGLPVHDQLLELTQTHVHWVSDAIQPSHHVVPFSSWLQSFPALRSFKMSQFVTSGSQSIGVSASASVQAILLDNSVAIINQILLHSYPQKQGPWSTTVYLNHRYELFQQRWCQKLSLYVAIPNWILETEFWVKQKKKKNAL